MIVSKTVLWNSATFLRATHYYLEAVVKESVQLYLYPPPWNFMACSRGRLVITFTTLHAKPKIVQDSQQMMDDC